GTAQKSTLIHYHAGLRLAGRIAGSPSISRYLRKHLADVSEASPISGKRGRNLENDRQMRNRTLTKSCSRFQFPPGGRVPCVSPHATASKYSGYYQSNGKSSLFACFYDGKHGFYRSAKSTP